VRLTFVIQRYGEGVVGGAESYVETMATGLAAEGHTLDVVTSCATSYADWADVFEPGTSVERGVTLHRFGVRSARDNDRFVPLHLRMVDQRQEPAWPWAQDRWSQMMGPDLDGAEAPLAALAAASDATVLVGYHYSHTQRLTRLAAAHGPTVVVPTAHPEGAFHVGYVRRMFEHADRVVCLAPEEGDLIADVAGCAERIEHVPCPVDPVPVPGDAAIDDAVRAVGATRGRYAVVVGRIDPAKGSDDAVAFADRFRRLVDPSFELVVIGPGGGPGPVGDAVRPTGFVDEDVKRALVAGAAVALQPSYMESFSLALVEGWLLGRPALVQGRSKVLLGHVERSGGGLAYTDYPSFEAALATVLRHPEVAGRLADAGERYSRREFDRARVLPAFAAAAERARSCGRARLQEERVSG
jgi:glycosyltransferase involved in cell wall biosynthesis